MLVTRPLPPDLVVNVQPIVEKRTYIFHGLPAGEPVSIAYGDERVGPLYSAAPQDNLR